MRLHRLTLRYLFQICGEGGTFMDRSGRCGTAAGRVTVARGSNRELFKQVAERRFVSSSRRGCRDE
jgi:hypothetical protein